MASEDLISVAVVLLLAFLAGVNIFAASWGREMVAKRKMKDMMRALRVWLRKT
jgi:hypothetical protein